MIGTLALASGKGGVGKTVLAVSLGHALVRAGARVLLVDADLGLANVDVQLGLVDDRHLGRALAEGRPLAEMILREETTGLDLLLGPSGWRSLAGLDGEALERLAAEIELASRAYDVTLLDLPAGIGARTLRLARLARRVLLVATPEPTALTDTYALLKVGLRDHAGLGLVVNMAEDRAEGAGAARTLATTARRFLGRDLPLLGIVRRDPRVADAIARQRPLLARHPTAPAAADIEELARLLLGAERGAAATG
jgi:flagellar biosynthesis protein FlhG